MVTGPEVFCEDGVASLDQALLELDVPRPETLVFPPCWDILIDECLGQLAHDVVTRFSHQFCTEICPPSLFPSAAKWLAGGTSNLEIDFGAG